MSAGKIALAKSAASQSQNTCLRDFFFFFPEKGTINAVSDVKKSVIPKVYKQGSLCPSSWFLTMARNKGTKNKKQRGKKDWWFHQAQLFSCQDRHYSESIFVPV